MRSFMRYYSFRHYLQVTGAKVQQKMKFERNEMNSRNFEAKNFYRHQISCLDMLLLRQKFSVNFLFCFVDTLYKIIGTGADGLHVYIKYI